MIFTKTVMKTPQFRKFKGFTLVELIVVITILAILGTIGFLAIGGYSSKARDSARIGDTAQISKSLDIGMATS
jgi:prepilin-type N-terminal cleavage/methylation domain-containing protein